MLKLLCSLVIMLVPLSAMAQSEDADLNKAIKALDHAYATNDVETYFGYMAQDAIIYYGGNAQTAVDYYHDFWTKFMAAGGGVELNEASDTKVRMMPGGEIAIATSFIVNRTRAPGGATATTNAYETDVWHKTDNGWKLVTMHYSTIPAPE
ncbi:MAG: nuclear transport factor 2 family protein [Emcibacteraceae bacterium]|nr:nuclear transport factor 2 family protein [Emcibacteraceae bacterium]